MPATKAPAVVVPVYHDQGHVWSSLGHNPNLTGHYAGSQEDQYGFRGQGFPLVFSLPCPATLAENGQGLGLAPPLA